jgi:hypothetical protein
MTTTTTTIDESSVCDEKALAKISISFIDP